MRCRDAVIILPREVCLVRELTKQVADELSWTEDWLNGGAKSYLVGISEGPLLFQASGIEAHAPSMEQLLAMKLSAWSDDYSRKLGTAASRMKFGRVPNCFW